MKKKPFTKAIREINKNFSFYGRYEYRLNYIKKERNSANPYTYTYKVGIVLYDHALGKYAEIELQFAEYDIPRRANNIEVALIKEGFYLRIYRTLGRAAIDFVSQTAALRAINPYEYFEAPKEPKRLVKNGTLYNI